MSDWCPDPVWTDSWLLMLHDLHYLGHESTDVWHQLEAGEKVDQERKHYSRAAALRLVLFCPFGQTPVGGGGEVGEWGGSRLPEGVKDTSGSEEESRNGTD